MVEKSILNRGDILSIANDPVLYVVKTTCEKYVALESIEENPKQLIKHYETNYITSLNTTGVYINDEEKKTIPLMGLFSKMKEILQNKKIEKLIIESKNKSIILFEKILSNYDRLKVTYKDMQKIFKWYNILLEFNKI